MTCARREAGARRPALSTSAGSPRRPEPRPGRGRARLFRLLPALALLLGAFSLFAAAPAQAQGAPAPTNLTVTPGGGSLDVSWTAATVNYYAVAYTSNGAVAADGVLRNDGNAALGWVAVNNRLTTTSISITGLNSGTAYRVRVQGVISGNPATRSAFVVATGTPNPTVTLSVSSTSISLGNSVTLTATLSSAQTGFVTVNIGTQAGTAHTTLYTVPSSIFIGAGQTTGMITIVTTHQVKSLGTFQVFISSLAPQTSGGTPIFNPVNGTPSSAPLTLTITESENADLAALSATKAGSAGGSYSALTLSPSTFVAATTAYTATVPFATTHVKLRVRGEDESSGYITGNLSNIPVASVQASLQDGTTVQKTSTASLGANLDFGPVALSVGENPITVQVTAQDGTTTKDYTVTVTRQQLPAPTGLQVVAGNAKLDLTWTAPTGTLTGYDVHYTSAAAGTVGNDAAASGSNPATAWVAVTRSGTTASQTISSLSNDTAYRVRVRAVYANGNSAWVFGTGTPATAAVLAARPTVSLSVFPTTVAEGGLVSVVATLSATPAAAVTIPITVTLDSAEAGDFSAGTLAGLRAGFAFPAGQKQKVFNLGTTQDTDAQDEKFTVALGTLPTGYVAGDVTSVTVTIEDDETKPTVSSLRTLPSPPEEGEAFTVAVTLSALPAVAVNIPLTVTLGTAEPEDFDAIELAWLRSNGIPLTTTGHVNQASDLASLNTDLDREDETFTVAIDPDGLAELGLAMAPGAATSLEVTIKDLPWLVLKINDGDRELLIGPSGELGVHTDPRARWVEVSPTTKSVTLTVDWLNAAIASAPTAQVRYVMHGIDGDTLTWDLAGEKNTSKTLELYSPLGSPGYPRLTLSAGNGIDYTIYFHNNGRWEFHQDTLLKILEMRTQ